MKRFLPGASERSRVLPPLIKQQKTDDCIGGLLLSPDSDLEPSPRLRCITGEAGGLIRTNFFVIGSISGRRKR